MASEHILARLRRERLVVVARRLEQEHIAPVARALVAAGVPALEITLDGQAAAETIAALRAQYAGRILVGAGTALQPADVEAAVAAGAEFVVSPVFVPEALEICRRADVLYVPGAITPADIFQVLKLGLRAIKVFPASMITPAYIRDVLAPFRSYEPVFMLTGGLDDTQIPAYLAAGVAIVGVGSSILAKDALAAQEYSGIESRARAVVEAVRRAG